VTELERTVAVLEAQRTAGLHPGACVVARLRGESAATASVGEARPGVPMGPDTVTAWFSMTKLTVALRVAMAWEAEALGLDDRAADHIPELAGGGRERITIRHLLTHTSGLHAADDVTAAPREDDWDEEVARICRTPLPVGWEPGRSAAYSLRAGFHLLAEVVRRAEADERAWEEIVAADVFAPLGMRRSWLALDDSAWNASRADAAMMWACPPAHAQARPIEDQPFRARVCQPGASGRGRVADVPMLLECLLRGVPLLSAVTAEAVGARHRTGLRDGTFGAVLDWGLGVIVDAKVHGAKTVPYGYGPHASARTFGHGGSQSSGALCDPEHGLVAVLCCTGMPGDAAHSRRANEVWTALYEDLGLAGPAA